MWSILKSAVEGYIAHGALSRGAAIAFYVVTSLAPVLLIVVAVAGIVFGQDAVRGSFVQQLGGLFGQQGGELTQRMLASSSDKGIAMKMRNLPYANAPSLSTHASIRVLARPSHAALEDDDGTGG